MKWLFVILVAVLTGCDQSDSSTPAEIRIGYFANLTHAQAVLGTASGDFERAVAPSKLSTKVFAAGPALIEALFAGEIDVGYVGPGPVINAHALSHGEGIRVISGSAANGVVLVARSGAGIESVKDLVGKKIATPQRANTQDVSARHFLKEWGATDLSNIVPISNAEQSAMMAQGQIDAAWVPEPWGARLISENGAKLIAEEKDLWPAKEFSLTVVVTTPEFLKKHPDVVEKVLKVHHAWTGKLVQAPDEQLPKLGDALAGLTGKRLPVEVLKEGLHRVKFTDDPLPQTFATMAQWSADLGFAKQMPKISGLMDTSIMDRVAAKQGNAGGNPASR